MIFIIALLGGGKIAARVMTLEFPAVRMFELRDVEEAGHILFLRFMNLTMSLDFGRSTASYLTFAPRDVAAPWLTPRLYTYARQSCQDTVTMKARLTICRSWQLSGRNVRRQSRG